MTETQQGAPATTILDDTICMHCGYNLRGLSSEAKCPECFGLIEDSLRGNLLKFADQRWLRSIHLGVRLKLWNIVVGGVCVLVVGGSAALTGGAAGIQDVMIIAALFGTWASFVITSQEPRLSLTEDPVTWRTTIRACAVASLAHTAVQPRLAASTGGVWLPLVLHATSSLVLLVATFGELLYLRRFADRIPDRALEKATRTVQWGLTISGGLILILPVIALGLGAIPTTTTPTAGGPMAASMMFACYGLVFGLATLVFTIWYISLLFKFKYAVTRAMGEPGGTLLTNPNRPPVSQPNRQNDGAK